MITDLYNNFSISSLGLIFTLNHCESISLSKAMLIMPFIMHKETVKYLSNEKVTIRGIDELIIDKPEYFTNFNNRFLESLPSSINAIQFLSTVGKIKLENNIVKPSSKLGYDNKMGSRAKKIDKASRNLSTILNEDVEKLYLNLRIII